MKNNKGITLIALVITIIVMLILVAVTISMAVNGGLFNYAGDAAKGTNDALKAEQELSNGRIKVGQLWYNNIDDYLNEIPSNDQGVKLIEFKIDETTYNAKEGMTWGEWVATDSNTIGATVDEDNTIKVIVDGVDKYIWIESSYRGSNVTTAHTEDSDEEIKISNDTIIYTYYLGEKIPEAIE